MKTKIQDLRKERGVTQSELADAVDVFGADVTEAHIDGDYGYYKWLFDHGYSTSIELDYSSGKLNEVWIMKYDTLQDN